MKWTKLMRRIPCIRWLLLMDAKDARMEHRKQSLEAHLRRNSRQQKEK